MKKHLLGFTAAGLAVAALTVNAAGGFGGNRAAEEYPAPTDVTATVAADGVQLDWQVHFEGTNEVSYTETFESFMTDSENLIYFGNYTTSGDLWAVKTGGNQGGKCLYGADKNPNNDWLISPELNESAQTITFYAKEESTNWGAEKLALKYSMDTNAPGDFVNVKTVEVSTTDWTLYSFDIPVGAKYFAIVCISVNISHSLLDDITFIPKYDLNKAILEDFDNASTIVDNVYRSLTFVNNNGNTQNNRTFPVNNFSIANVGNPGRGLLLPWSSMPGTDNWIISSEVLGGTPLSFDHCVATKGAPTKVEVYAAMEPTVEAFLDTDPILVIDQTNASSPLYKRFSVLIPENARYFAIRVNEVDAWDTNFDNILYYGVEGHGPAAAAPAKAPAKAPTARDIEGFNIYRNGEKLNEEPVAANHYYDKDFKNAGNYTYTVEAVYNDGVTKVSAPVEVTIENTDITFPKPYAFKAEFTLPGVAMTWDAVDMVNYNREVVTETFNTYSAADVHMDAAVSEDGALYGSVGPWKLVNRNNANHNTHAFKAWDIAADGFEGQGIWSNYISSDVNNDDWIISPMLNPDGQTISFMAKNGSPSTVEKFNIYYSVSTDSFDDLVLLTETPVVVSHPNAFREYSYELPEGTKYFAIQCVSEYADGLFLDNITYIPAVLDNGPARKIFSHLLGYNIYRNGEKINEEPLAKTSYLDTDILYGQTVNYYVTAAYQSGESVASNEVDVVIPAITLPAPTDLDGTLSENGVDLTWVAADITVDNEIPVTEDFQSFTAEDLVMETSPDSYGAYHGAIGPWILVNNNGATHQAVAKKPYAFKISNGNKYLYSNYIDGETYNDDWLISPRLNRFGQTISFKAMNNNAADKFNIWYSTTDTQVKNFIKLTETPVVVNHAEEWREYSYELPEGAKYFAIQCVSLYADGFCVDDITYTPAVYPTAPQEGPRRITVLGDLLGYNVYRNGEKINETPMVETSYNDSDVVANAVYTYVVKAAYRSGESEPTNEVTIKVEGDPIPEGVKASIETEGINVTWKALDLRFTNRQPYTETFEECEAHATEVAGWTMINRSGAHHYTSWVGYYPYAVADGAGHNGGKALYSGYLDSGDNDDWAISPLLNDHAQTITLWARVLSDGYDENFEVLASSTDTDPASFTVVENGSTSINSSSYHEFTYNLPEGTKYFAIHYISKNVYGIYFDDITFIPAQLPETAAAAPARKLRDFKGYNVYCNGEQINDELVEGTSFLHNSLNGAGTYEYAVSAVYASGETELSEAATVTINAEDILLNPVEVFEGNVSGGKVTLSWATPEDGGIEIIDVEDDLSGYTAADLQYDAPDADGRVYGTLGDWKLVNNSGASHQGGTDNVNPWALKNNALECGFAAGMDNWIISPELSGEAQVISFKARGTNPDGGFLDEFTVYGSYTTDDVEAFTYKALKVETINPVDFMVYDVPLPEGIKYFAINDKSNNVYGMAVTDFVFQKAIQRISGTLLGYNVYRQTVVAAGAPGRAASEWVKVNDNLVTENTYVDYPDLGTHNYKVTAVYPFGESELSDGYEANVTTTGVESVSIDFGVKAEYYNLQGVKVENPVKGHIYIMRSGNTATKVLVK